MLSRQMLTAHVPVVVAIIALLIATPFALAAKGGSGGGGGGGKSGGSTTGSGGGSSGGGSTTGGGSTGGGGSTSGGGSTNGGGSSTPSVAPLALASEWVQNSPNPAAPTSCLNEDDYDQRVFAGSLGGSVSTSYDLCNPSVDYAGGVWWDAGGIGLQADLYIAGTVSDLAIVSPLGDAHHAVLVGSTTSKGVTTDHYQVCYVPPYSASTDTGGTPLAGGTWQVTLSGQSSEMVSWTVNALMSDATFQKANCPPSEQNLTP